MSPDLGIPSDLLVPLQGAGRSGCSRHLVLAKSGRPSIHSWIQKNWSMRIGLPSGLDMLFGITRFDGRSSAT